MIKKLLILIIAISINAISAEFTKIDSLEHKLSTLENSIERIDILNDLSRELLKESTDEAMRLSNEALQLSERLNYISGKADANKNLGYAHYYFQQYEQALDHYFTSLKLLENMDAPKDIADVLGNIGIVYYQTEEYEEATSYISRSLDINRTLNNKAGMANAYNNLGNIFFVQNDLERAIQFYNESLQIHKETNNTASMIATLSNMGISYIILVIIIKL